MYTIGEIGKELNRLAVYLSGLQNRFELPVFSGAGYSAAYLRFLEKVVYLRSFGISEERIRDLWEVEKKILQLLHVDTVGSPTWFLDSCLQSRGMKRRLLLSNYDLGVEIGGQGLQLGLNFEERAAELFFGHEMGEDVMRVLQDYLKQSGKIRGELAVELPRLRGAVSWGRKVI